MSTKIVYSSEGMATGGIRDQDIDPPVAPGFFIAPKHSFNPLGTKALIFVL